MAIKMNEPRIINFENKSHVVVDFEMSMSAFDDPNRMLHVTAHAFWSKYGYEKYEMVEIESAEPLSKRERDYAEKMVNTTLVALKDERERRAELMRELEEIRSRFTEQWESDTAQNANEVL